MNRAERRARARRATKGREERRTLARAMKSGLEVAQAEPEPFPNLRAAGFVLGRPRLHVPRGGSS